MSVKIALLGFGTVASGVPFLLKENGEKIVQAAHSEIEVAKVLVKDDEEKVRLLEAGNDFNFVTNIDEILSDKDITIVVELMGRIEPAKTFITRALEAGKHVVTANKDLWLFMVQNCLRLPKLIMLLFTMKQLLREEFQSFVPWLTH